jgi:23S rRNA (uracil1939-C5)-methyltransferase
VTETFEVRIDSIGSGGDGVGRRDGIVVFVPRAAPGDLLRVRGQRRDRMIRAEILSVMEASPHRVDADCRHYVEDRCGGCQIQHISYDAQIEAKARIIHDALTRIGKVSTSRPEVDSSDKRWRYRGKLTLALRRRGDRWIGGLHRFDTAEVFELEDCPITDERAMEAWRLVLAQQDKLPRAGELRGAVRLLSSGFSFTLEGGRDWTAHPRLVEAIPSLVELWWKPEDRSRRLLASRESPAAAAGAAFTQVNPGVAAKLREWVIALASAQAPETAVDGYSGTGDIAVALARQGTRVVAIEIDRDAARVAATRLPAGSRAVTAAIEDALPGALPADVVVLNPPRAGVDAKVADVLRSHSHPPKALIYVSCDPATLARDVRRFERYRIRSLRGFDMFPQTSHVETVCELVPAA